MRSLLGFVVSRPAVSYGCILVVCAALYANSLDNDFQYDDRHSIVSNHHVRSLGNIPGFFMHPEQFSRDPEKAMFRPLLLATFALNHAWGEYEPGSYHVVNVAIHALCAVFVVLLLRQFAVPPCISLLGGLLFAVHPICTEPVNYVSSRSELLAGLGVLGSLWLSGRANSLETSGSRVAINTIGSLFFFIVGLLSKSVAIVLPFLLVFRDLSIGVQRPRSWRRYTPYALVTFLYLFYMKSFLATALVSDPVRSLSTQFGTQLKAIPYYLKLLFLPSGLTVAHSFQAGDLDGWTISFALVALVPIVLLIVRGWRSEWQIVLFGLGMMLISAAPTLVVPLNVLVNEHRMYLPLAGAVIAVVGIPKFESIRGLLPGAVATLALFSVLVIGRNPVWANEWSLWKDASQKAPHDAKPYVYMGNFARERGDLIQSAQLFRGALQRDEGNFTARANLANTLRLLGRHAEATAMYEELSAQYPESSDVHYNLGRTYQDMGEGTRARRSYLSVDKTSPHLHMALNNIGTLHEEEGRLDSALYYYNAALTAELGDPVMPGRTLTELAQGSPPSRETSWTDKHLEKLELCAHDSCPSTQVIGRPSFVCRSRFFWMGCMGRVSA